MRIRAYVCVRNVCSINMHFGKHNIPGRTADQGTRGERAGPAQNSLLPTVMEEI